MPISIAVASTNPVKLEATRHGFYAMFPATAFELNGIAVPSGVSDQPISNQETYQGALNRAKSLTRQANFAVGIEGGVEDSPHGLQTFAWVVIISENIIGHAKTATFFLPDEIARLVRDGYELGDADDIVFGESNSKQKNGAIGLLTGDIITRTSLYVQAVKMALIPFKNPSLSWSGGSKLL